MRTVLLLLIFAAFQTTCMESEIIPHEKSATITNSSALYKKHIKELTTKTAKQKKKSSTMQVRYRAAQAMSYLSFGAMIALSFQCPEANTHSTVKEQTALNSTETNPANNQTQGTFMIQDLTKFILGIAGGGLMGLNDLINGWMVPAWQNRGKSAEEEI